MRFAGPGHDTIATVDERGDLLVHRLTQNDNEIEYANIIGPDAHDSKWEVAN